MYQIFLEALLDSAKMIPFLLAIYIGIELVEYRYGRKIREKVSEAGAAGPAVGALSGSFPQCGSSVVATALYTQRLVTIGTLLAVYLSTSDEAIPVILSQPDKAKVIIPLILTKVVIALVAGYAVDFAYRKSNKKILAHVGSYAEGTDSKSHHHEAELEKTEACCGHNPSPGPKRFSAKEILFHPMLHTAKVFAFILGTSLAINLAVFKIGESTFENIFAGHIFLQPFLAAIIGLIPNCAASVAITELYLKGAITFGAVIAGLSSAGGLGLLILFREERDKKNVFQIVAMLLGISIFAGLVLQYLL